MMTGWCLWRSLSLVLDGEGQAGGKVGRRKDSGEEAND